ncbi:paraquat-inducible protein A [Ponticoccus sp. SC2-23]|uniref:paraquat-inducible protein A n=1 Tax=Alexandriicola marinus TaxID=2081710 RepID=UPI000FDC8846|nr:paraquat-inducible protein A [Alexandriicola marinus]MBM1219563.1 paraquat-inducible protein A [Ponticoccus sp. SC6-9]MBM1223365.1 paraquat-inducible protein A [Ponticoccus sp. SC6-15]MBM1229376.1 paraquat-inducible protein A [Ponticoccus sp. SC6-38]MBM1232331.1 paraquat-inducible protein A [Ponticoccus sp. SC6-45]MBM1237719.1 paraquat-inducible protein A [Ponticoccus sp. SC6-49]MBM1241342.1 paraquat-inducible protein A [Ponticoccus sp. SC2-64]MBM1245855.1 paraquat-inducible protein A [Po
MSGRPQPVEGRLTAREAGLVGCRRCSKVWPLDTQLCGRCGATLRSRDTTSISRVWAWWVLGVAAYIPANLYPMLRTQTLVETQEATIVGGAIELMQHGSYGIAIVILVASVLIPVAKFLCIAFLAMSSQSATPVSASARQQLYEIVEYVGRWSMIDVFVVAILASLVQLDYAATVNPGPASLSFALSVIFTMLSAQAFDSRIIWDGIERSTPHAPRDPQPTEGSPTP